MTQGQWVRRVIKPAAFVAALVPAGLLLRDALVDALGANPIEEVTHRTGFTTITLLMITLAVTPLRRLTGVNALVQVRRMLGLFAFFYASLHLATYIVLDQFFAISAIVEDVAERPYITVGFTTFLLLVPLAVTSTNKMVKRLGAKRWQQLHRLVYIAAAGGVLHFLWMQKADFRRPVIYGIVLVALLGFRLVDQRLRDAKRKRSAVSRQPSAASRQPSAEAVTTEG